MDGDNGLRPHGDAAGGVAEVELSVLVGVGGPANIPIPISITGALTLTDGPFDCR
ncbi:hypothetical protein [Streptomyces sp. NPDC060205]|uniref:hypothetical protein n=1 Tax=Streptomyces sp. NPDC060205 TaxID=3347072 RepID=UPI00364F9A91